MKMRDIINTVSRLDEAFTIKSTDYPKLPKQNKALRLKTIKAKPVKKYKPEPKQPTTPAQQFIAAVKAEPRAKFCSLEEHGRDRVILTWLEGSGGLVPFLTSLADQFGVTLDLMVEVYSLHDGGRLVPYYQRNGFVIEGSDFPEDFDFTGMPYSEDEDYDRLQGIVSMTRKPQQP